MINTRCKRAKLAVPARATLYRALTTILGHQYRIALLPSEVRATLFNLSDDGRVRGDQLVFHCLNYGGLKPMSFAAGLPWIDLYQAARKPGWRPKSRGVLEAICRVRKI